MHLVVAPGVAGLGAGGVEHDPAAGLVRLRVDLDRPALGFQRAVDGVEGGAEGELDRRWPPGPARRSASRRRAAGRTTGRPATRRSFGADASNSSWMTRGWASPYQAATSRQASRRAPSRPQAARAAGYGRGCRGGARRAPARRPARGWPAAAQAGAPLQGEHQRGHGVRQPVDPAVGRGVAGEVARAAAPRPGRRTGGGRRQALAGDGVEIAGGVADQGQVAAADRPAPAGAGARRRGRARRCGALGEPLVEGREARQQVVEARPSRRSRAGRRRPGPGPTGVT